MNSKPVKTKAQPVSLCTGWVRACSQKPEATTWNIWSSCQLLALHWHTVGRATPKKGKGLRLSRSGDSLSNLRIHQHCPTENKVISGSWEQSSTYSGAPWHTPHFWELTNTQEAKQSAQQLTVWRRSLGKQEFCLALIWGTPGSTRDYPAGVGAQVPRIAFCRFASQTCERITYWIC